MVTGHLRQDPSSFGKPPATSRGDRRKGLSAPTSRPGTRCPPPAPSPSPLSSLTSPSALLLSSEK